MPVQGCTFFLLPDFASKIEEANIKLVVPVEEHTVLRDWKNYGHSRKGQIFKKFLCKPVK